MKKKLLSTLLALCVVLALVPAAFAADTSGSCGDGVTWSYKDGTLTIEGKGDMDDYTVVNNAMPPWYDDYSTKIKTVTIGSGVTRIGDMAFRSCIELTKVTIPDTVTSIGLNAFTACDSLTSVTIPGSVELIEQGAFEECIKLTKITVPNGVKAIGANAFSGCESLTEATIPDSVTIIGDAVFSGCKSLTSVTFPNSVPRFSVQNFLSNAFRGCTRLTSVSIPEGVTGIGWSAFENCTRLSYVVIPESVTSIDSDAFRGCPSLTDVYYAGSMYDWYTIDISSSSNDALLNAVMHYDNGTGPSSSDPLSTEKPAAPETPSTPTEPSVPTTPSAPAPSAVVLSPQKLTVDGKNVECEKYNIDGSNYFKLRDLAFALNGTGSQFGVGYDAATSTVTITKGAAYTPAGEELSTGVDNSGSTQPSSQTIRIDGTAHSELTVYNIGGSNFFQLRELGNALGFEVDFDASSNTAIVRSIQK